MWLDAPTGIRISLAKKVKELHTQFESESPRRIWRLVLNNVFTKLCVAKLCVSGALFRNTGTTHSCRIQTPPRWSGSVGNQVSDAVPTYHHFIPPLVLYEPASDEELAI